MTWHLLPSSSSVTFSFCPQNASHIQLLHFSLKMPGLLNLVSSTEAVLCLECLPLLPASLPFGPKGPHRGDASPGKPVLYFP